MKHPTKVWRAARRLAVGVTRVLTRLEVTGSTAAGPAILASNHISPFDPVVLTAACRLVGADPAFLSHAGPFNTPVLGSLMRTAGHIRVERDTPAAPKALNDALQALKDGRGILIYPEGRISLDPGLWPERGKTGIGRLVLATGAPVIPIAVWGAHEVVPYAAPRGMVRSLLKALRDRPVVKVHFGEPVDLSGIDRSRAGAAQRITGHIVDAIIAELTPLRADEPDTPRFVDPSRPLDTRRSHRRVRS